MPEYELERDERVAALAFFRVGPSGLRTDEECYAEFLRHRQEYKTDVLLDPHFEDDTVEDPRPNPWPISVPGPSRWPGEATGLLWWKGREHGTPDPTLLPLKTWRRKFSSWLATFPGWR